MTVPPGAEYSLKTAELRDIKYSDVSFLFGNYMQLKRDFFLKDPV
jgi:hypothetical protein